MNIQSLSRLEEALLERSMGLLGQAQGIFGRRRYTHTNVALNNDPICPQCSLKGQPHRRGHCPVLRGRTRKRKRRAPTEAPYWES